MELSKEESYQTRANETREDVMEWDTQWHCRQWSAGWWPNLLFLGHVHLGVSVVIGCCTRFLAFVDLSIQRRPLQLLLLFLPFLLFLLLVVGRLHGRVRHVWHHPSCNAHGRVAPLRCPAIHRRIARIFPGCRTLIGVAQVSNSSSCPASIRTILPEMVITNVAYLSDVTRDDLL